MDRPPETDISIARATPHDKEDVRQVCEACYDNDYILLMGGRFLTTGTVLIARVDEEPVGLVRLTTAMDGSGWLSALRVVPSRRRSGVARALCRACEEVARGHGSGTIRLWTEETNDAAHSLFRGLSYRTIGVFTRWWGEATSEHAAPRVAEEIGDLWPRVSGTMLCKDSAAYVPIALRFCQLSETVLRELASSQMLYRDDQGTPCILDQEVWKAFNANTVELTMLADDVTAQVQSASALASQTSSEEIGTFLPAGGPWASMAEASGLRQGDWGNRAVLCERSLG